MYHLYIDNEPLHTLKVPQYFRIIRKTTTVVNNSKIVNDYKLTPLKDFINTSMAMAGEGKAKDMICFDQMNEVFVNLLDICQDRVYNLEKEFFKRSKGKAVNFKRVRFSTVLTILRVLLTLQYESIIQKSKKTKILKMRIFRLTATRMASCSTSLFLSITCLIMVLSTITKVLAISKLWFLLPSR